MKILSYSLIQISSVITNSTPAKLTIYSVDTAESSRFINPDPTLIVGVSTRIVSRIMTPKTGNTMNLMVKTGYKPKVS